MSLMWMPALMIRAPLALARRAVVISGPIGAKTIAPSICSGGASPEDPAHSPRAPARRLSLRVTLAGKGEDAAALVYRDLAEDVGGGAEAVEADPLGIAVPAQRPVADQPGAEQRRRLLIRIGLGDRETEALVRNRRSTDMVSGMVRISL